VIYATLLLVSETAPARGGFNGRAYGRVLGCNGPRRWDVAWHFEENWGFSYVTGVGLVFFASRALS